MLKGADILEEIKDAPLPDTGAPNPTIIGDEQSLFLIYTTRDERTAVVKFENCVIHKFGAPNDEALSGHELYKNGLHHYGIFKVSKSSWLKDLEKMNSAHPRHDKERFLAYSHFIFTFHDSTFECISAAMNFELHRDAINVCLKNLVEKI